MHEITLSQRALEIIEQQAQQAGARRVTGVWLKVGAFSCVEASALTFCFELVCRGTLARGANCISPNNRLNAGANAASSTSILSRSTSAAARSAITTSYRSWRMTAYRFSV
nr:hypothetical protein KV8917_120060 [Klebsiella variicola]